MLIDRLDWVDGWPTVRAGLRTIRQAGPVPIARPAHPSRGSRCPAPRAGRLDRVRLRRVRRRGPAARRGPGSARTARRSPAAALRWPTEAADLTGTANTAGVLLRTAPPGDYIVETKADHRPRRRHRPQLPAGRPHRVRRRRRLRPAEPRRHLEHPPDRVRPGAAVRRPALLRRHGRGPTRRPRRGCGWPTPPCAASTTSGPAGAATAGTGTGAAPGPSRPAPRPDRPRSPHGGNDPRRPHCSTISGCTAPTDGTPPSPDGAGDRSSGLRRPTAQWTGLRAGRDGAGPVVFDWVRGW